MVRRGVLVLVLGLIAMSGLPAAAQESNEELAARLEAAAKKYKPSFPADKPFDEKAWTTDDDFALLGDPAAKKGGLLTSAWRTFPPNIRTDGPESNLIQTSQVHGLVYESLLGLHPDTLKPYPRLARWWQKKLAEDGKSEIFRFRIDPDARWADGSEVTADDVVATYEHMMDKDRKDPSNILVYSQYDKPVAEDKYTVRVTTKKLNWRLFLYFSSMKIFPAKYVRPAICSGADYLKGYQWKLMLGSGPYHVIDYKKDVVQGQAFVVTRRKDWWGANKRWAKGLYNFDRIKWVVVLETTLQFEKVKKGELDFFVLSKAQRWAEECEFDKVKKGWVLKRRIYTQAPQGFSGMVLNMRKPPFDDRNVRRAWAYLFNRKKLMEKLFFNQYEYVDSYWPGSAWGNPDNPKVRYNPRRAVKLLAKAGYKNRNKDGWLVNEKTGKPFEVDFIYGQNPSWKRILTVIKEDYEKAGIKMNLVEMDWRAAYKKVQNREFTLAYQAWGAIIFPNPRTSWSSKLADQKHNNNVPGFKNERVDRYLKKYDELHGLDDATWAKRREIIRKIDKIVFREYPYALGWYGPFTRILYQNKFGHPKTYFSRIGDEADIFSMWWVDPEKEAALKKAMADGTSLPRGETDQKPFEAKKDK